MFSRPIVSSRPMPPSRFWTVLLALIAVATGVFALAFPRPSDAQALVAAPVLKGPVSVSPIGIGPISISPISVSRKPLPPPGAGTLSPYVDPAQFSGVPFGSHSHWAQPWRAYLETVPAATLLGGIGAVAGSGDPAAYVPALASKGVRHMRYEEGWCQVDFNDPSRLDNADSFRSFLLVCKASGVRPLILLNGNTGVPCPTRFFDAWVAQEVKPGDTTITLVDTSQIVPGHTGLTNVTGYAAARPLFTAVSGNVVTLSQPCPVAVPQGGHIVLSTLRYAPFTTAGSDEYNATIAGWQQYMRTVAVAARAALGTVGKADGGFDIEIWNELTFGSEFLDAGNYGLPSGPDMPSNLVGISAAVATGDPDDFKGVGISDGFGSTTPWPAASWMPQGITAISKHPYAGASTFPAANYQGTTLDALCRPDSWVPSYSQHFPEYYGTAIQTESLLRDCSPFDDASYSYAGIHGRYARGQADPVPVWITEYRTDYDGGTADELTKSILRFYCFYLNKGVTQADYFNSDDLLGQPDALTALSRICMVMRQGLDRRAPARSLMLQSVSDTHGHAQFRGDGTKAHPDLLDRECFAFLPYQVNSHRFVVPYYVMTRDVAQDLPDEAFTLRLSGLGPWALVARSYDPLTGKTTLLPISRSGNTDTITLSATDTPRLLILDDSLLGQLVTLFTSFSGGLR